MKSFLLSLLMIAGCATTQRALEKQLTTPERSAPVMVTRKYVAGDCVRFSEKAMAKKTNRKVDGTVMFVLGYKRDNPSVNAAVKYVIIMKHPDMKEPVEFTAVIKVFDQDTDKVPCPK